MAPHCVLSVTNKPSMLIAVMLSFFTLNVVAPIVEVCVTTPATATHDSDSKLLAVATLGGTSIDI